MKVLLRLFFFRKYIFISHVSQDGKTALILAALGRQTDHTGLPCAIKRVAPNGGHTEIARILLKRGANVNSADEVKSRTGRVRLL